MASSVRIELEEPAEANELGDYLRARGYSVDIVTMMVGPPDVLVRKPRLKRTDPFLLRLLDTIRLWMLGRDRTTAFAVIARDDRYEFETTREVEAALTGALR